MRQTIFHPRLWKDARWGVYNSNRNPSLIGPGTREARGQSLLMGSEYSVPSPPACRGMKGGCNDYLLTPPSTPSRKRGRKDNHTTNYIPPPLIVSSDSGFTLIELALVLLLVGILAFMFSEMISAAMDIYADHTQRKTMHIDCRRAYEQVGHDLREFISWQSAPSQSAVDFNRYTRYKAPNGRIYYAPLRTKYNIAGGRMTFQRSDGQWSNQYTLIPSGVAMDGTSAFAVITAGGKIRVQTSITVVTNNRPLRMRMTTFPRFQG